jgi:hypothetical protein
MSEQLHTPDEEGQAENSRVPGQFETYATQLTWMITQKYARLARFSPFTESAPLGS